MSQINIRNLSNENDDGSPEIVGVSTFSATSFFVPPKGSTAERPSDCEPGSIRFNTDTANLEYFRGKGMGWSQFELVNPNLGGGTGSNTGLGTRGVFGPGEAPHGDTIDYHNLSSTGTWIDFGNQFAGRYGTTATASRSRAIIFGGSGDPADGRDDILFLTISTLGNTQVFGELSSQKYATAGLGSRVRGVFAGGYNPSQVNTIEFVTFASLGDVVNFGDMSYVARDLGGLASSTRGLFFGGISTPNSPSGTNSIEYITIASEGNAVNFGDAHAAAEGMEGMASSTRGLIMGGHNPSTQYNNISFVTISTTGNTTDFGDMQAQRWTFATGSNSTRGMIGGGRTPAGGAGINTIDFVTIATTGDATNFGDLTVARSACDGVTDPTRFVVLGGYNPSNTNIIDFVTISTTGDATDFGDSTYGRNRSGSCSNGHGGL